MIIEININIISITNLNQNQDLDQEKKIEKMQIRIINRKKLNQYKKELKILK